MSLIEINLDFNVITGFKSSLYFFKFDFIPKIQSPGLTMFFCESGRLIIPPELQRLDLNFILSEVNFFSTFLKFTS